MNGPTDREGLARRHPPRLRRRHARRRPTRPARRRTHHPPLLRTPRRKRMQRETMTADLARVLHRRPRCPTHHPLGNPARVSPPSSMVRTRSGKRPRCRRGLTPLIEADAGAGRGVAGAYLPLGPAHRQVAAELSPRTWPPGQSGCAPARGRCGLLRRPPGATGPRGATSWRQAMVSPSSVSSLGFDGTSGDVPSRVGGGGAAAGASGGLGMVVCVDDGGRGWARSSRRQ